MLCLLILALSAHCQSALKQAVPSSFESATLTLVAAQPPSQTFKQTSISFAEAFIDPPLVLLSLARLEEVDSTLKIQQNISSVTASRMTHRLQFIDSSQRVSSLKIRYAALLKSKFAFLSACQTTINYGSLTQSEYTQIDFLTSLSSLSDYDIGVFLTGIDVETTGLGVTPIGLEISAELYTHTSFLLGVSFDGAILKSIQITRFLIDKVALAGHSNSGKGQIIGYWGYVQHYDIYLSDSVPQLIDFYEGAFITGVIQFTQGSFDIFGNPTSTIYGKPNINPNMRISFILLIEMMCDDSEPFYEPTSQTCYDECGSRTYSALDPVTAETICITCHRSCYTCSGTTSVNCTECLADRVAVGGQCTCKSGLAEDPSTGECEPCSFFVRGCATCDLTIKTCLACETGCSLISSIQCSCPATVCGQDNNYKSPHTGACLCLPQFYLATATLSCEPCGEGCFLCEGEADNCSECVDRYQLVGLRCIYFYETSFLIDSNLGQILPTDRCISKANGACIEECAPSSSLYHQKCYSLSSRCPVGTLSIVYQAANLCHPCPFPCAECHLYYQCRLCHAGYYITATGLCLACSSGCQICSSGSSCMKCEAGLLVDGAGGCYENISAYSSTAICLIGCSSCAISEVCEQCDPNYFLLSSSRTCIECSAQFGVSISSTPTLFLGSAAFYCTEDCGDGVVINHMCDDGNRKNGDGCSSACTIEPGYECDYSETEWSAVRRSTCFKPDYLLDFQSQYVPDGKNRLQLTLRGDGIAVANLKYSLGCRRGQSHLQFDIENVTASNSFEISYFLLVQDDFEGATCSFDSIGSHLPTAVFTISSDPAAEALAGKVQDVLEFLEGILKDSHVYIGFLVWGLCILSIDPFDLWLNLSFLSLFVAALFNKEALPTSVYCLSKHLRFILLDLHGASSPESYLEPAYFTLMLLGGVIAWNELIVRLLKIRLIFPPGMCQFFTYIFQNRFILYIAVWTALLPVSLIYCLRILPLLPQKLPLIIFTIHCCLLMFTFAALIWQANRMVRLKSMRKFLPIFSAYIWLAVFTSMAPSLPSDGYLVDLRLAYLCICGVLGLVDSYPEQMTEVQHFERNSDVVSALGDLEDEQEEKEENDWEPRKKALRKITILFQFTCYTIITVLQLLYHWDYVPSHQLVGLFIACIFVFGNLLIGIGLGIISHCLTAAVYLNAESPLDAVSAASVHPIPEKSSSLSEV